MDTSRANDILNSIPRVASPQTPSTAEVANTYNWDTVFAIPVPDVNKAIVEQKSSPDSFIAEVDKYHISGGFGDWQMAAGGDGKNIRLFIPMHDVQIAPTSGDVLTIASAIAIVEIKLHFIPHSETSDGQEKPFKLVVRDKTEVETDPVASLVSCSYPKGQEPGMVAKACIEAGITAWCNSHLDEFAHVFAVVNLNEEIDEDAQWSFCKPSYTSYAFLDKGSLEESVFAVLCMTGDRSGEKISEQLSPYAIPDKSKAGFLLSQTRFLSDLMKPALKLQYGGSMDDWEVATDGASLNLQENKEIELKSVKHEGLFYTPVLKTMSLEALGQEIRIDTYTETEIVPGVTACCKATHWYNIKLGTCRTGQTLNYNQAQDPAVEHTTREAEWVEVTEIILGIIAAVIVLILAVLTDGIAFFVGAFIISMLVGVAMVTPEIIELIGTDDAPSMDLLVMNTTNPIKWPGGKDFKLDYAGLNTSFQLGGEVA